MAYEKKGEVKRSAEESGEANGHHANGNGLLSPTKAKKSRS
jgi:hypothetical protein